MEEKSKPELSKALSGKFQLKNVTPGEFVFKGEKYDTTTMDVETAEKLVKAECPYIERAPSGSGSSRASDKTS